ncbi:glycosyltransferase [Alcaligenaceae bacterium 429]|nr:glycosyltransferase [Alcaligenaceae bacterium 429]
MLSVVIPLYNEAAVLPLLIPRLLAILQTTGLRHEIVFVDDGSQDNSLTLLRQAVAQGLPLRIVVLSRNFGKEAAVSAGLEHCKGDAVIVMDADLQDPPELIPDMVLAWAAGADVVTMKRRTRQGDSWLKRSTAHLYYRLLNRMSSIRIPADTGDFRLMSRQVIDAILQLPERNRYNKGLFAWVGFNTHVIEYDRAPRPAGQSKWNYLHLCNLALDGITSFSSAPLRLILLSGLLIFIGSMITGVWLLVEHLYMGTPVTTLTLGILLLGMFSGLQLSALGLVGDYVGKAYLETKQRPVFLIKGVIGADTPLLSSYQQDYKHASHI